MTTDEDIKRSVFSLAAELIVKNPWALISLMLLGSFGYAGYCIIPSINDFVITSTRNNTSNTKNTEKLAEATTVLTTAMADVKTQHQIMLETTRSTNEISRQNQQQISDLLKRINAACEEMKRVAENDRLMSTDTKDILQRIETAVKQLTEQNEALLDQYQASSPVGE